MGFVPQSDFILAVVPQSENNLGINPQNGLGINPQNGLGINPHVNLAVIPVPPYESKIKENGKKILFPLKNCNWFGYTARYVPVRRR